MTFRLFGYDVEITGSFWITTALMGYFGFGANPGMVIAWILLVLVSITVHELGHAFAFQAYGIPSQIQLYHMGGLTMPLAPARLTRLRSIVVSVAGPAAGLALGLITLAVREFAPPQSPFVADVLRMSIYVNIYWSFINLLPVLPFDGGHVMEAALGPRRYRWTLGLSALVGTVVAILALLSSSWWLLILFGSAAVHSFTRLRELQMLIHNSGAAHDAARTREEPLAPATERALREAKLALEEDDPKRAIELAEDVMAGRENSGERPKAKAVQRALEVKGWAHLALGNTADAAEAVTRLSRMAHTDPALLAAVAFAKDDLASARRLLEAARADNDKRKEVFGPLIQILLRQNEHARAGALAFDCVDQLSTEDLRVVAGMVADGKAHGWAGKLFESAFKRERDPNDAFEAARVFARAGEPRKALDLLRVAIQSGFTDVDRVFADDALVGLDDLDHVVSRPA